MAIDGYIDYKRREYCKDIRCPIQGLLDKTEPGSADAETVRGVCIGSCIHTTYEFHHWLIEKGYELVRPRE